MNANEQTKKCPKCQEDIQLGAKKCKHCGADLRNWFMKHKILTGFLILCFIGMILPDAEVKEQKKETKIEQKVKVEKIVEIPEVKEDVKVEQKKETKIEEEIVTEKIVEVEKIVETISSETVSQKNAVRSAKAYLEYSAFSYDGLVVQLEYEQFSHTDAIYGVDNSGANWNEQAAKSAKSYMAYSAFSHGSLIEQLKYEGFTQAQAEYGTDAVGL